MKSNRIGWGQAVALCFPLGVLAALLFACEKEAGEGLARGAGEWEPLAAGFGPPSKALGRRASEVRLHRSEAETAGEKRVLKIRSPSADRAQPDEAREADITVAKGSVEYGVDFSARRTGWKYLTKSVRDEIDRAGISSGRWSSVVIHNSGTDRGDAEVFDFYHRRVRGMRNGLAYHFVIGNGTYSKNGEIEVGHRWAQQLSGGHLANELRDRESIGICLVGDLDRCKARSEQLEALDELIDYLEARIGSIEVTTHRSINPGEVACPGRYFPDQLLLKR